jgi:V/A-type H+-transporting ATPase subunit E
MDGDQVVEKILSDARAEAQKIIKLAEQSQAAEQAEIDKQLDEHREQTKTLAEKAAKDKKMHLLSAARMDIAKQLLAEKRRILDEVFAKAHEQLLSLSDEEYRRLITNLMVKSVETGDEEIIVDKNEKRIDLELINQVNQQLGPGNKRNLKLSDEKQDIGGGFILNRGKIKNNVSLDILLAQARRQLEIELAKELFQG